MPLPGSGRIGAAPAIFQNAAHIVRVQDAELRLQSQQVATVAHDAHAQRVKSANQHFFGRFADQAARSLAHLAGRFVGEGDGRDALWL